MINLADSLPACVQPVPPTTNQVLRLMVATAMLVDGYLERDGEQLQPYLKNCYLLPEARIVLAGTICPRPLVTREFKAACSVDAHYGLLVRLAGSSENAQPSFDIHCGQDGTSLQGFRLWMSEPMGSPWLIGTAGEHTFVRLDATGLIYTDTAPFAHWVERATGFRHGSRFLSIALKGWF
jgi:hypothetical protein